MEKDEDRAFQLLQSAAWQGDPAAEARLGRCYEFGTGVEKDVKAAAAWYRKSAYHGSDDGQCCLAWCLENGPLVERDAHFPMRTNVEFVRVLARDHLEVFVWERGSGATLACGTGACASLVAAVLEGLAERRARVELPGGALEIEWSEADGRVYMTGPAEVCFTGDWPDGDPPRFPACADAGFVVQ